jgi:hypothetical protein
MPKRRNEDAPYWQQLRLAERHIIEYALEHGQTIRKTAEILGISPNYLSERTRELGITPPEVRPGPKPGTKPNRVAKPDLRVVPNEGAPARPVLPEVVRADTAEDEDEDEDTFDGDDEEEGDEDDEGEGDEGEDGEGDEADGKGDGDAEGDEGDDEGDDEGEGEDDANQGDALETGN